jgi:tryptophan-rich sensory protein
MQKYLKIIYCVIICSTIGFLAGTATQTSVLTWYPTLIKPFFNPPNWVFAPVWIILYIMMGIAAGLVWNEINNQEKAVKNALIFFFIQLGLNALWSILFFVLKNILLALIGIILLWLLIYETYRFFKPINQTAGKLLIPYLAWVSFATILNLSIFWLNK